MRESTAWQSNILYGFLIGNSVPGEGPVKQEALDRAIYDLGKALASGLGGRIKMGPAQAQGETMSWEEEGTTLFLALCTPNMETEADKLVEEHAKILASVLSQDEVWVTRQHVDVFAAKRDPV